MFIVLTDRNLIRRYGPKSMKIDDGMGITLVKHGKGYEVDKNGNKVELTEKQLKVYMDKMIKFPCVDKSIGDDCIFPELITASSE